ncbi:Vitamin B12 import ATP-binding protein BtuD [Methanimicrococcus stummii]|uniref:Vitamin B12 import ATP-binding protein BtuD n=1 Tax=Methanimicrococcus stummii TaxID=3028294 RepID=A0AA96VAI2_9EURY|nr:ABC transporter ATP-binding protein [Methanimicrococcus sp. Es2]WNY29248.1 Vitamin B12 import ATP-binding protein BtuD [Methanimicrococcus sp. Es2]
MSQNYYENQDSSFQKNNSEALSEDMRAVKEGRARLFEIAFHKKWHMLASAIFSITSVAFSFVPYIILYLVLKEILPNLSDLSQIDSSLLMTYIAFIAASLVLTVATMFISLMCSHLAAFETLYDLKIDFAAKLATLPLGYFNQNATGKLRKVMDDNIESIELFIAHHFPDLVGSFTAPVVLILLLLYFDWRVGLVCLVPIILAYLIQIVSFGGKNKVMYLKTYQDSLDDMNASAVEYVRGISVIKIFNQTVYSFKKIHDSILNYTKFCIKYTYMCRAPMTAFTTILNNISFFIIPVGIWWVTRTTDYAAFALTFIFYLIFSASVVSPFMKLMYVSNKGDVIIDGIRRMDETFNTPSVKEPDHPVNPNTVVGRSIRFENVSFSYTEDHAHNALSDVSFEAAEGQITALVGKSGSGKSTIAHLIPRFWDVDGGVVYIGDTDIRDLKTDDLMDMISFVFQDVFLFKQSVRENIRAGKPDATDEEIRAAAKAAQCDDFIRNLPNGYDTIIQTQGIHLSGGERQRIAIARAILKDSPIIVLDEATAFADPENEYKIQEAFKELIREKTVIMIAHRLPTIRTAHQIIVMSDGKVAESGAHDELIQKNGAYKKMWDAYNATLTWRISQNESKKDISAQGSVV